MQSEFKSFAKKYWLLLAFLIITPLVPVCFIICRFHIQNVSDWISLLGTIITYMGTVTISVVALFQAEQANTISKRAFELSSREYTTAFQLEGIEYRCVQLNRFLDTSSWGDDIGTYLFFFQQNIPSGSYNSYKIGVKNFGIYPITYISISGEGYNEEDDDYKTLERDIDTIVDPGKSFYFAIYNFAKHDICNTEIRYRITCRNIYKYSTTVELKIKHVKDANNCIQVGSSYEILDQDTR